MSSLEIFKQVEGLLGEKLILLEWNNQPAKFVNFLKLADDGTVLWWATPTHPLEGVWVDVRFDRDNGKLEASNFAGNLQTFDYNTGRITHSTFTK